MPCVRHVFASPGDSFSFQLTDLKNALACFGRLRITGPNTGHSEDFSLAQLQGGVGWVLAEGMSYTLRILVALPQDPTQPIEITVQTSDGDGTCSRDGEGQIGVWTIDVLS
jgi:hypothetical protein